MKFLFLKILIFVLFVPFFLKAATCETLGSGNWTNTSNWSCGRLPIGGDTIIIHLTHTIGGIPSNLEITGDKVYIDIYGTLDFGNSGKLTIPSGSEVIVQNNALIKKGSGSGGNNVITIGTVDVWKASDGNLSGYFYLSENCTVSNPCVPLNYGYIDFFLVFDNDCIEIGYEIISEEKIKSVFIQKSYNLDVWDTIYFDDEKIGTFYDCNIMNDYNNYYKIFSVSESEKVTESSVRYINILEKRLNFDLIDNYFYVKNTTNKKIDFILYDAMGKVLVERTSVGYSDDFRIFVNNNNSFYLIKVFDGDSVFIIKRIFF